MMRLGRHFTRHDQGNVAMIFAIALPVMIYMIFLLFQFRSVSNQKDALQTTADFAALAIVREQAIVAQDAMALSDLAKTIATGNLDSQYKAETPTVVAKALSSADTGGIPGIIEVSITQPTIAKFQTVFGWPDVPPITVTARAQQVGGSSVCVIALDGAGSKAMSLTDSAALTANQCSVYSNSTNTSGISATKSSLLTADAIYSSGGTQGTAINFSPEPVVDYPALNDPLALRPAPTTLGCDYNKTKVGSGTVTLQPGVYCGGIQLMKDAIVTLDPGIYVIKDGPLNMLHGSSMTGTNVGFFLEGNDTNIHFFHESFVSLSAPVDGEMAGLLFFDDRDRTDDGMHIISSDNARYLVGTIYMPKSTLRIDADQPIADQSEYTAIVARNIDLQGNVNLVINSNYDLTDVPVPEGLGLQNGVPRLVE